MASPSPTEIATLGLKALNSIKAVEPPQWLSPSPLLSEQARAASQYLFSALLPFCPDSPLNQLLLRGFDAEQIWHQIDLQTQPQISKIRREVKKFEKNPEKISVLNVGDLNGKIAEENKGFSVKFGAEQLSEKALDVEEEFDESVDGEENGDFSSGSEENEDEEEDAEEKEGINGGVEDQFLKIRDLEKFLKEEEAREFESEIEKRSDRVDDDDEDDDDDDEEEDDDDDEMGGGGGDDEDVGDDADGVEKSVKTPRYKDFFGGRKEKSSMKQSGGTNDELEDDDYYGSQDNATLSTHEKELEKVRSTIEQLERANLETKSWTMQGEVTAKKRPVNSALEVDLDFRHNVRPVPVITEEATTSLEDIIKRRISEGQWDDVQRKPRLPSKAPTERKEMDENKSQKGLAELYEEDYVQKAGLASAPQSFREKQMQEASILFKKLCLKLDALSHFHFAPKPVIEDMSIQANLPALAMEEIAPVAVSDAAMLAPEEVFAGKGDIKENTELTQEDRKRRRASKKRKFKAETAKQMVKEARDNIFSDRSKGQEP